MYLMIAIAAYVFAAYFLYNGVADVNVLYILLAAILTTVGKFNIKRHKENR